MRSKIRLNYKNILTSNILTKNILNLLLIFSIISLSNFIFPASAFAQEKLIFALDVIRHGDRTPTNDIPNATYHWPEGRGQLTPTGMQQEYQLGTRLRKKYVTATKLLPRHYANDIIYVRSSDVDRTLMSAQAVLLGLYPLGTGPRLPHSSQFALPNGFQPIPIHTVPKDKEDLLIPWTESQFKDLLKKYVYPTAEWQQKTAELQPKFASWSKATGITITDLYQLKSLGDALYINNLYRIPPPVGLSETDMQQIIATKSWIMVTGFKSPEIGKITGSQLLKTITDYLQQARPQKADQQEVSSQKTNLKYVLFSSHDTTMFSLMSAMSAPIYEVPGYASNINFALYEVGSGGEKNGNKNKSDNSKNDNNKKYVIKITFNDNPVKIPGCENKNVCSLEQFAALTAK